MSHTSVKHRLSNVIGELMPGLSQLCRVTADLTDVLTEKAGLNGQRYWELNYEVAVLLGGTKLQAQLRWNRGVSRFIWIFCSNTDCRNRVKRILDQSRCSANRSFSDTFKESIWLRATTYLLYDMRVHEMATIWWSGPRKIIWTHPWLFFIENELNVLLLCIKL
jgi:hypothetical protein